MYLLKLVFIYVVFRFGTINVPLLWIQIFWELQLDVSMAPKKTNTNIWRFLVSGFAKNGVMAKTREVVIILNLKQLRRQKLEQCQGFTVSCATLDNSVHNKKTVI